MANVHDLKLALKAKGFSERKSRRALQCVFDKLSRMVAAGRIVEIGGVRIFKARNGHKPIRLVRRKTGLKVIGRREWRVASRAVLFFAKEKGEMNVEKIHLYRGARVRGDTG